VLIFNRHVRSDRNELLRIFGEAGRSETMQMAFEATYDWGWFADLLEDVGIPAHMARPRANADHGPARVEVDPAGDGIRCLAAPPSSGTTFRESEDGAGSAPADQPGASSRNTG
jgi:hypothetical protein